MQVDPAAEAIAVTRTHGAGRQLIRSLEQVSLRVDPAEVVAVMGPSGSGKSTLLQLLAGLDRPDSGAVRVAGVDWQTLGAREQARFRRRCCGFIAQGMTALPQATAAENIEVPLLLDAMDGKERQRRVLAALEEVELAAHAAKLPEQLSGGQQQRVAIARALVARPAVVLADEPTGNLDAETAQVVVTVLVRAAREHGSAVVLVTHDPQVARHADRVVRLRSGRLDPDWLPDPARPGRP
jgi:ABC-type lipoprotein export system ATPase subunit